MALHLLSYNLQGLSSQEARDKTRLFVQNLHPRIDILCIQEHKLRDAHTAFLSRQIWPHVEFVVAPASDGVHARRNNVVLAGKRGNLIAVGPRLKGSITARGTLPSGCGSWVHLDHFSFGLLGVLSVYAPNEKLERALLWRELFSILDPDRPWIIASDFNNVEDPADQRGGKGKGSLIAGQEKIAWLHFKRRFKLEDSHFLRPGMLKFSWDNQRKDRHDPASQAGDISRSRCLRRLDRVYYSDCNNKLCISTSILPGYFFSDHAPVLAQIEVDGVVSRPTVYRMNASHLKHLELLRKLEAI
ncbi:unnamed protein product [Calypogeia fissa]